MTVAVVQDARPPLLVVRAMNPIMRVVLRSPLGRLVPFALLEFQGRHSGRLFRVPVGWHEIDVGHVVVTPAPWRENFRDRLDVTVYFRGRRLRLTGKLDDDPDRVAATLQSIVEQRGSLRPIGIRIPPGHHMTADDIRAVDRALIRFEA